ncbi:MAG: hypothetical protein AB1938_16615 [Myxococcota bacterium]
MSRRRPPPSRPSAPRPSAPRVVSLSDARLTRRLATYRERLDKVLHANKLAVTSLFTGGTLFTRTGARAGRDLLLAHEHLLRASSLLDRLAQAGDVPAPRRVTEVDAIFTELSLLLERTDELTRQTGELLKELPTP